MFSSILKHINSVHYKVKKILHKNIFIRSVLALSIPIMLIVVFGSYVGWNTSITAIKFDIKLAALIIGGSILCALDGFWYVRSLYKD